MLFMEISHESFSSMENIKKKMIGIELDDSEIKGIINDICNDKLNDVEIAGFIFSQQMKGLSIKEIVAMINAFVDTGSRINFGIKTIYDKHSTGGVPGNKVTLLIVPIVAAAGLVIPKTCSRAITSPSGTADTMEVLAPVQFKSSEMIEMANKTNGIIVEASKDICPVDYKIIQVERYLHLNPESQMVASILSKKVAMGINKLVLDVPIEGTKIATMEEGQRIARKLVDIGKQLDIEIQAGITYGGQPVGNCIGPALEAQEAIEALTTCRVDSLVEKSISLAGMLLEMSNFKKGKGRKQALEILKNGKAKQKFLEIIEIQGGDIKNINDIQIGQYDAKIHASQDGYITRVNNSILNQIAVLAGAPFDKGAGIKILGKRGDKISNGDVLLEIFSESETKLTKATSRALENPPILVEGMLLDKIN
ncbi:MAG: thymidine phosphorylase [Candidatus Lokiarchaeota archaeon]|nr:thymidine phosphorylase [Candidatus Lokiarchaeota archaeon]